MTTITRAARRVALSCEGSARILLSPELAEQVAAALLSGKQGPARALLDVARTAARLVVVTDGAGWVAVGQWGQYGEQYAGWPRSEARAAAAELLRVAGEIEARFVEATE